MIDNTKDLTLRVKVPNTVAESIEAGQHLDVSMGCTIAQDSCKTLKLTNDHTKLLKSIRDSQVYFVDGRLAELKEWGLINECYSTIAGTTIAVITKKGNEWLGEGALPIFDLTTQHIPVQKIDDEYLKGVWVVASEGKRYNLQNDAPIRLLDKYSRADQLKVDEIAEAYLDEKWVSVVRTNPPIDTSVIIKLRGSAASTVSLLSYLKHVIENVERPEWDAGPRDLEVIECKMTKG